MAASRWRSRMQGRRGHGLRVRRCRSPCRWRMLLMLRSRRATPIQDIVDGATTENRTDCRQKHRLCISTPEHLDSKCRRERDRELRTIVCRSASVQQESRIRRLLGLDALDDLGPFALELAGILNRGGLGGAGGSNLGGLISPSWVKSCGASGITSSSPWSPPPAPASPAANSHTTSVTPARSAPGQNVHSGQQLHSLRQPRRRSAVPRHEPVLSELYHEGLMEPVR